jgi:hypothetical protein
LHNNYPHCESKPFSIEKTKLPGKRPILKAIYT